jgi:hypothetical protein
MTSLGMFGFMTASFDFHHFSLCLDKLAHAVQRLLDSFGESLPGDGCVSTGLDFRSPQNFKGDDDMILSCESFRERGQLWPAFEQDGLICFGCVRNSSFHTSRFSQGGLDNTCPRVMKLFTK